MVRHFRFDARERNRAAIILFIVLREVTGRSLDFAQASRLKLAHA
ncbi:MAG TPA: hypothetical protein VJR26_00570 [Candidatus Acidoferrales bacterium]|nr:hypothetical protein [Candidatus Acidoferrales bacterium]